MKSYIVFFAGIFLTNLAFSQTKIFGTIKDNKGKIVPTASISIKNAYDGTVSDSTGAYSFKTYEKGNQIIVIKSLGYKTIEQAIVVNNEPINLNVTIKEEVNELSAVTVTAGSFEASDKKRASVVLSSIDIVTTANANADVTGAVKTLPGAQQVGEQEGLFVRGGTAAETRVFIDGTAVNNFFFSSVPDIAQRGRFSPFLFKGTIFSSGGYSALYGQALSGALILESIDLPERSEASLGISSVGFSGGFQQLAKNKKSSWGVQLNNTNLKLYFDIVKQRPDYFQVPNFNNAEANFRIKTKRGGMIKYYTYLNDNKLGLRNRDIDSVVYKNGFGLTNFNWYNNISWKENLGNGWKFNAGISFSTNTDKISFELQDNNNQKVITNNSHFAAKSFALIAKGEMAQAKLVFEKRLSGINMLRFGAEHWYNKDVTNFSNQYV
ncbi:MAG: carboxypeptidase-like regulatory domain-containing protein, partial [Chitinophagaceae bacterium]